MKRKTKPKNEGPREINELDEKAYKWYVADEHWKHMEPSRMITILERLLAKGNLTKIKKERVHRIIDQINEGLHTSLSKRNAI